MCPFRPSLAMYIMRMWICYRLSHVSSDVDTMYIYHKYRNFWRMSQLVFLIFYIYTHKLSPYSCICLYVCIHYYTSQVELLCESLVYKLVYRNISFNSVLPCYSLCSVQPSTSDSLDQCMACLVCNPDTTATATCWPSCVCCLVLDMHAWPWRP
jgi:hypothetical protein